LRAQPEVAVQGENARAGVGALAIVERALHVEELSVSACLVGLIVPPADDPAIEALLQRGVEEPGAGRGVIEVQVLDRLVREVIEARPLAGNPKLMCRGVAALFGFDMDARLHDADEVHAQRGELSPQLAARAIGELLPAPAE